MKREDKTMDLKGRHFLTLKDFTPEEIIYLLDLAAELKEKKKKDSNFSIDIRFSFSTKIAKKVYKP